MKSQTTYHPLFTTSPKYFPSQPDEVVFAALPKRKPRGQRGLCLSLPLQVCALHARCPMCAIWYRNHYNHHHHTVFRPCQQSLRPVHCAALSFINMFSGLPVSDLVGFGMVWYNSVWYGTVARTLVRYQIFSSVQKSLSTASGWL